MADGLWIDRRHRQASPHQPRRRRECLGELYHCTDFRPVPESWIIGPYLPYGDWGHRELVLVQIDGSEHAWFEDRGETCTTRRSPENVWVAEIESGRMRPNRPPSAPPSWIAAARTRRTRRSLRGHRALGPAANKCCRRGTVAPSRHGRRRPTIYRFREFRTASQGWSAGADHDVA